MNIASFRKHAFSFATLFVAVIMLAACSKDKKSPDLGAGYPKEVTILYKVSSPSGMAGYNLITYKNETGGDSDLWDGTLPFTKEVKKKVEWAESISVYGSGKAAGSIKCEIYINGKLEATETATSNNTPSALANYQFR
jgi:hypothetical protein